MKSQPNVAPLLASFAVSFTIASVITFTVTPSALAAEPPASAPTPTSHEGADPPPTKSFDLRPGFGARVGGYGFRTTDGKWDDCKMGGVGLFGTLDAGRYAFFEFGADSYQASPGAEPSMDRVSVLTSVAAGLRAFPDFFVVPFAQIGTGMEWTRAESTTTHARIAGLYPIGFLGVGAELNFFRHIKAGAMLRFLMMAHPNHDESANASQNEALRMEYMPASQGQFYLRYVL